MICNTRPLKRYKVAAHILEGPEGNNGNYDLQRDPFEDLPYEVIHHIMSFLPNIKYVAQLSVLSHLWLHLWSTYPYLDFFGVKAPTALRHLPLLQRRLMLEYYTEHIIRSSFLRRPLCDNDFFPSTTSKIYKFYLDGYLGYNGFYECINSALMHDVEDMKLKLSITGCYNLPEELFTCKAMRNLELSAYSDISHGDFVDGLFRFPLCYTLAWLNGDINPYLRSQLRTLSLDNVVFSSFEPGIAMFSESYFPYLTSLSLSKCQGVDFLKVSCPNLVYLDINQTKILKIVLRTPNLITLRLLSCFTKVNEQENTLVDIWAPRLQVLCWSDNAVPSRIYVRAPTHLIKSVVSLQSMDIEEATTASAKSLLAFVSRAGTFITGDSFLMLLAKLDFHRANTRHLCKGLVKLKLRTAMTKKQILGFCCLLRRGTHLRILDLSVTRHSYTEDSNADPFPHNWGRHALDSLSITTAEFWAFLSRYLAVHILQELEIVKIEIKKDIEESDIRMATFLLKNCRALKYFTITANCTLFNQSFIDFFRAHVWAATKASPDVQMLFEIEPV